MTTKFYTTSFFVLSSVFAVASVNAADLSVTYSTAAAFADYWQVANITPTDGSYFNPISKDGKITNRNKYSQFNNGMLTNAAWKAVKTGTRTQWTDDGPGWITSADNPTPDVRNSNGFYAYRLILGALADGTTDITLNLKYTADDYLAAVLMVDSNTGVISSLYEAGTQTLASSDTGKWQNMDTLTLKDVAVEENANYEFIFVVHNTDGGSTRDELYNATGLNLTFDLTSTIGFTPVDPKTTPEPATMLMFGLGIAGVAAARRIRRK